MDRAQAGKIIGVAALVALLACPGSALAEVTVNTTADNGALPGQCSGAPGDCSLRQAIDKAATTDTINVPPGNYVLTLGASLGVFKNLSINGAGARLTSVSANGFKVFVIGDAGVSASLSGMTISGGHQVGTAFLSGGAIQDSADSLILDRVTIRDTIEENTSSGGSRGAGIVVTGTNTASTLTITNSTIANNKQISTAGGGNQGAGVFATYVAGVTITNSTIANNSQQNLAGGGSSGAAVEMVSTPATLLNATIAGNAGGSSLRASNPTGTTPTTLTNTIVASGGGANCTTPLTSGGHNLETADVCGLHAAGDKINTDPLLGSLADDGGQTDTMALLAASPAIDAGDPAACPATDQRGVARVGGCDIGAFEYVPPPPPDITPPSLSQFAMAPDSFAAAGGSGPSIARKKRKARKTGSSVSYTVNEAANVTFTVQRQVKGHRKGKKCVVKRKKGKRCKLFKTLNGSFARSSTAGKNTFKFTGRLGGKRLRPGSYKLIGTPVDAAGNKGKPQTKSFKIKR